MHPYRITTSLAVLIGIILQTNLPAHFSSLVSELALITASKFRRRATNRQLARLLDLGLEGDLVAIPPHLGHERLAGEDGAGETNLDVLVRPKSVMILRVSPLLQ